MNQAIQILDGFTYISAKETLKIDFMEVGQLLACYICGASEEELASLYKSKQFEIEEIIELKLEQGKLNLDGEIWITVEEISAY